jgi:hypothetical protein
MVPAAPITFVEAGDTGELPESAQAAEALAPDALVAIEGNLADGFLAALDVDMFRIHVHDPAAFSASTVAMAGISVSDPMLFLFDAAGHGVYMNDDDPSGLNGSQSRLPSAHPLGPTTPGVYFLAIAWFDNQPVTNVGSLVFAAGAAGDVRGPADVAPLDAWDHDVLARPDVPTAYRIELTGAGLQPVRIAEPPLLWLAAGSSLLLGLATRRRRTCLGRHGARER